ncbi:MAG TPA: MFS transporter [Micropepsaceae bacterium]|nr:MFS transporter [Micropepsaceae bacterium]
MAVERALNVAELIEGKKLARPQIVIALWLCTLMVLEGYDMQTLSFATPAILREWQVSRSDFGFVLTAHLVGYFFGAMVLSFLGDRLGRKNIIIAGAMIFGAFTFAAGFATSPQELYLLRLGAGFGLGGAIPSGIALAAEYMPVRLRATVIGLMFVGYNVGAGLGGFIAAATIKDYGWSSVFFIGGLAAIPMFIGLALALPESVRFLIVSGGPTQQIAAIVRRLSPQIDLTGITRYVVGEESRKNSPLSLLTEGRAVVTILLWVAFICSFTGHYFITLWMPTVLSDDGFSDAQANSAMGLFQFGGAIGSFLIAFLLDRLGIRVVALTFLLTAPIVAALGLHTSYGVLLPHMLIAGVGVLGGQIGLNALAGTIYPTYMRAMGAGWGLGIGRVGSLAGPIAGGYLLAMGIPRPTLLVLTSIPLFCCAVALYAMYVAKRNQDERAGGEIPLAKGGEFAH